MYYVEILWRTQSSLPLLALLQLLPMGLALLMVLMKRQKSVFPVSVAGGLAVFLLTIAVYGHYDHSSKAMQLAEKYQFFGAFHYHAAVDGVSVLFTLLTGFLTLVILLYGRVRRMEPTWRFTALVFAIESTLMSQFVAVDLLWFALASFIQLALIGYLLKGWTTSVSGEQALNRYLQFMGVGAVLLLASVMLLGWNHSDVTGGRWSFELYELAKAPIHPQYQSAIFFLFFYGLAIRIPLFPLHGWLPSIAEHGTVAVAPIFLLGLKVGIYGLYRFVFPLMHEAVMRWHEYVVAFSVAGVFYAAVLALMQVNMRRLLAYAVVSHTGILIIGLFSLGYHAFEGGILLSVNFGLAIAGLLFMTGFIYSRTQTLLLSRLGGLFDRLPLVGTAFLIAGLSIIGMPGTPGFDSVHLVLEAAIERFGTLVTVMAALGNVVAAGFLLLAFQRAFLAQSEKGSQMEVAPATGLERIIAISVIAVLLITGFYSEPWLELVETSLEELGNLYRRAI